MKHKENLLLFIPLGIMIYGISLTSLSDTKEITILGMVITLSSICLIPLILWVLDKKIPMTIYSGGNAE